MRNMDSEIKKPKPVLGRGMAALFNPSAMQGEQEKIAPKKESPPIAEGSQHLVDINRIQTNKDQPRKMFKEQELKELADSIRENGIVQPLIVSLMDDGQLVLIAGERRLRAAKLAGLERVPVVIKKVTKRDTMVMAIIENVQRSNLNCVEEALAYFQLMDEFKLNQDEVAQKIGKERSTIANFLRILKLPREVLALLQKETLSFGHAKILASVKDQETAKRLANEAVVNQWSVRDLENAIGKSNKAPTAKKEAKEVNKEWLGEIDIYRQKLQRATGFHIDIRSQKQGQGQILLAFTNEAEFNDLFEFLTSRK